MRRSMCSGWTFAPSSKWPKTGFRLSKGRKKPACAVSFLFCKCHAVLTKALSCFPNDFHLSWVGGGGGSHTGATGGRAVLKSKRKSLYSTEKTNKSPPSILCHLWSYQLRSIPIGASRAERTKTLSFKLLTFESHCTVYSCIRAGSVCPLGGVSWWMIYHVVPRLN